MRISGNEVMGKEFRDIWPEDVRPTVDKIVEQVLEGKQGTFDTCRMTGTEKSWWAVAVAPIFDSNGVVTKFISINSDITQRKLAEEVLRNAHEELERKVAERTSELTVVNQELEHEIAGRKRAEEQIRRSLMEKETLLRELYHRTKNNMQVITSLLNLQANAIDDKKTLQIFEDTKNRIRSMALVHENLYQAKDLSHVSLGSYIRDLTGSLMKNYQTGRRISLLLDVEDIQISMDTISPCGLVLNELMTNSLKYAFPDNREGRITITGRIKEDGTIELGFSDNGVGFPEGTDFKGSKSLGLRIVRTLVETQMKGNIEMQSADGVGFAIRFKEADNTKRI